MQKHGKAVFGGKLVLSVHKERVAVKSCNSFQVKKIFFSDCVVWMLQLKTLDGDLYFRTYRQTKAALVSDGRQATAIGLLEARRALRECVRQADAENNARILEVELAVRWPDSPFRFTGAN